MSKLLLSTLLAASMTCTIIGIILLAYPQRYLDFSPGVRLKPDFQPTYVNKIWLQKKWEEVVSVDKFQAVDTNSTLAYVYSAFLDDRQTPDTVSWRNDGITHVIRIFAWFERYRNSPLDAARRWKCVLWNDRFDVVQVVEVSAFTDTNSFDKNSEIARAMLLCPYKPDNCTTAHSCQPPLAVSVVTSSSFQRPINLLRVVDLPTRRQLTSSSDFGVTSMPKSIEFGNSSKPFVSFAVCPRPFFGKSITVDDLIQFIEVNRVFGAELFFFYIDDSIDPNVRRCIREYERQGLVESIPWEPPADLDQRMPEKGQYFAMTECTYRLMYRTEYLVIKDFDEFIVPTRTDNWRSMLALIDTGLNRGTRSRIASYSFRNRFFLPDVESTEHAIPANWTNRFRVLTKITGETKLYPWKDRSKMMAPPERILIWHTHVILDNEVVPPGGINVLVDEQDAVLHHYRKQLKSTEQVANYTRMWHFTPKFLHGVRTGFDMIESDEQTTAK